MAPLKRPQLQLPVVAHGRSIRDRKVMAPLKRVHLIWKITSVWECVGGSEVAGVAQPDTQGGITARGSGVHARWVWGGGHTGEEMQTVERHQIMQPPYAPELNPVKRFFQAVTGRVFPTLQVVVSRFRAGVPDGEPRPWSTGTELGTVTALQTICRLLQEQEGCPCSADWYTQRKRIGWKWDSGMVCLMQTCHTETCPRISMHA